MKWAAATLAALALTACKQDPETAPPPAKKVAAMVAAAVPACSTDQFEGVELTVCIADPAHHTIGMVLGPGPDAPPYRHLAILAASRPASAPPVAFAMNGGMYDEEGQPIGYYVEQGKRLKTLNRNDGPGNFHMLPNGVFFGDGNKWFVTTADDFADAVKNRPRFATQSGPMLVINGHLHPEIAADGVSTNLRNGVGIGTDGRAYFVISEGPLSFGKFARYFRDELKTPNALYLDGKVSSLWDPAHGRLDNAAPLGPLIVVEQSGKGKS